MREEIIRMAREAGFGIAAFNAIDGYEVVTSDGKIITDEIERFYSLVAAAERERCAKEVESLFDPKWLKKKAAAKDFAAAIRAL